MKDGRRDFKFSRKINDLLKLSSDLDKIQKIAKVCLSNGAYSEKNEQEQIFNFDKLKTPDWERKIIERYWNVKRKMAHDLFNDLNILLIELEDSYAKKPGSNN